MSSKYSTRQYISAQYCDKQMRKIWRKNIQALLRYSNFSVGIFYFASPCTSWSYIVWVISLYVMSDRKSCCFLPQGFVFIRREGGTSFRFPIRTEITSFEDGSASNTCI